MRRRIHAMAAVVAVLAAGCGDNTGPEGSTLDVRVHVLASDFEPLAANLTDGEVEALFDEVNVIWQQADVQWTVTNVIREPALNAATYAAILDGALPPSAEVLSTVLPSDNLTRDRWDVFFVGTLGGLAGGVYLAGVPAVIVAEFDPSVARDLMGSGPRILAHELGHSLGLVHVPCTVEGNLMAPGCATGVRTRLTENQIAMARRQRDVNRPFSSF